MTQKSIKLAPKSKIYACSAHTLNLVDHSDHFGRYFSLRRRLDLSFYDGFKKDSFIFGFRRSQNELLKVVYSEGSAFKQSILRPPLRSYGSNNGTGSEMYYRVVQCTRLGRVATKFACNKQD